MTSEEIKIRRLTNQYLINPSDKITVVKALCGIQSQFMSNAVHSLIIRCSPFDEESLKEGLVKNWTVRGTVHVFAETDLPLFIHCDNGKSYHSNDWKGHTFWNQRDKWALSPERQGFFSEVILAVLKEKPCSRDELKDICKSNGMTESEEGSMFDPWGGGIRELCERGFMNYTVSEKKEYCLSPPFEPIPEEEAKLEIARRYFTNIAPATIHDAMYYFHTTTAQVKKWLSQLPVKSAECEGREYFYIENGKSYSDTMPKCLFLAGFDQLMLGYEKKESLFLSSDNLRDIFNLAGIVMPSVMIDGNVVGKWKRKGKKLTVTLFSKVTAKEKNTIKNKAKELWNDISAIDFIN